METTRESDAGYPEEEPPEVAGDQTGDRQRAGAKPKEGGTPATENDDGKATGNPNS